MTDVYIVCSDRIFRRMLCLELSECGANVMPEKSTPVPPCALLISAPDAGSVTIPEGDCLSVVFGYAEELSDIGGLDPTAVLSRPFDTDELMRVLFGDSGSSSSPTIRKITATGRLSVDKEKRTVVYHGSSSRLTKREFALLNISIPAGERRYRAANSMTMSGAEATEKTSSTFTSAICAKNLKTNSA